MSQVRSAARSTSAPGCAAFDDHAAELGELFAAPAAVVVHNAQILTPSAVDYHPMFGLEWSTLGSAR